jgi:gliding motility-associated-like protein
MFKPLLLSTIILLIGQVAKATDYYSVDDSGNWSDTSFSQNVQRQTINKLVGRDLYWVGKGGMGSWYDPANWAAASGGAGGELIPTAMDNVFFDANSFDGPYQKVISRDHQAYCKNMSWTGVTNNPINFDMWILNAYGSVELPENKVGGVSELRLLSPDQNQTLLTRGYHIYNAHLNGTGSWILLDTLSATNLYLRAGEFNSNGKPVTTETFFMLNDDSTSLKMGNSHWRITRNGSLPSSLYSFFIGPKATVDAGTSLLEFTNTMPTYIAYADVKFHNVLFSNPEGTASLLSDYEAAGDKIPKVSTFNRLEMRNSGIILGENVIDSLIFTAGKSYDLDAAHAQTIHEYFQLVGNPCDSIELRSTLLGRKAIVQMNGGVIRADFVQMRDQSGVGSTQFLAGGNSTNFKNSNETWVFNSSIGYVDAGVLGKDMVLCNHESITLDAHTFNFNEKHLWSDGSTQATLLVSQAGTHHVAVTYRVGCVLHDTVKVLSLDEFKLALIKDTTLCANQDLVLNADLKLIGATYRWHDGSSNAQIVVAQSGIHKVVVELSGCSVADSTMIRMISAAALNLGRDTIISGTESLLLDASKTGSRNYVWSDNSSAPTLLVRTSGTFWVEVNDGGCSARDSIAVTACPVSPMVSLGKDTTVCDDKPHLLRAVGSKGLQLLWPDGSTKTSFSATTPGTYWVEVSKDGCSGIDSMELTFKQCILFKAFTPNAFSPNGNNANEAFRPYINELVQVKSYELQVYDRWGGRVFRSVDLKMGWDGSIRGQIAAQGVYRYWFRIEYIDDRGPGNQLVQGEVSLFR